MRVSFQRNKKPYGQVNKKKKKAKDILKSKVIRAEKVIYDLPVNLTMSLKLEELLKVLLIHKILCQHFKKVSLSFF